MTANGHKRPLAEFYGLNAAAKKAPDLKRLLLMIIKNDLILL